MKDSVGEPRFPVWLIADSEPKNWHSLLATPLDPRHPARHSIWTSVLHYMQDALYRKAKLRFDERQLFIRNAVKDPDSKPDGEMEDWASELQEQAYQLGETFATFNPRVVLTFGAFAFEFARRAQDEEPSQHFTYWTTERLGQQFSRRISNYDMSKTNIVPLLHVSISRSRFLQSHDHFVGDRMEKPVNYFEYAGTELANLFLTKLIDEPVWIPG